MTVIYHSFGPKRRRPFTSFSAPAPEYPRGDDCFVFYDDAQRQDASSCVLNSIKDRVDDIARERRASFRLIEKP
jgi:hypothetical protein